MDSTEKEETSTWIAIAAAIGGAVAGGVVARAVDRDKSRNLLFMAAYYECKSTILPDLEPIESVSEEALYRAIKSHLRSTIVVAKSLEDRLREKICIEMCYCEKKRAPKDIMIGMEFLPELIALFVDFGTTFGTATLSFMVSRAYLDYLCEC